MRNGQGLLLKGFCWDHRETVMVWKEGHGAGPQKKHSPNHLGHTQDGKETPTRTSLTLEDHSGGGTPMVFGDKHSTIVRWSEF